MRSHGKRLYRYTRALAFLLVLLLGLSGMPARAATAIYTITAKKVNVRAQPDTESAILAVLRQGSELTLLESTSDGWLKVSANGVTGYVSAEYAELSGILSGGGSLTAVVTADKLNVRAEPASTGASLGLVRRGAELSVSAMSGGWLQVSHNGGTGYIAAEYARLTASGSASVITTPAPVAVTTPAPAATPEPVQTQAGTLKEGSRGDAVKALQQKLIRLGYLSGAADGIYGGSTKAAVTAFQKANGLTADGAAGAKTLSAVDAAIAAQNTQTGADALLKKGSSGDAVKALQQNLIQLGYLTGEADGVYGTATKNAVRAFQAASGLSADGAAGASTLAAIRSAIAAVDAASMLKEGSRGDAVKALQQKLIALGYLSGSADGVFGASTKAAVIAFQKAKGLTADGAAGSATLTALNAAYQSGAGTVNNGTITAPSHISNDNVVITPTTSISAYPTLKYGDSGSDVTVLQTRLQALGYFKGSVGGNFGVLTQAAVTAFQTAAGLTADGIVGATTWTALYAQNAPAASSSTLQEGDKGDAVKAMQARLRELGYMTSGADGDFGAKTKAAVQAFQTAAGMTADGVAGPQTLAALYAQTAPAAGNTVAPAPTQNAVVVSSNPASAVIRDTDYTTAEKLVALAKQYLGCTYIYAHQAPPYFDCSGLTYYCYKQFGYTLKRTAYMQGYDDTYPKIAKISDLQLGDLIYFNTNTTDADLSDHAAIYIGDLNFIHASSSAGKVVINSLASGYYKEHFSWGRRVLNQQ